MTFLMALSPISPIEETFPHAWNNKQLLPVGHYHKNDVFESADGAQEPADTGKWFLSERGNELGRLGLMLEANTQKKDVSGCFRKKQTLN